MRLIANELKKNLLKTEVEIIQDSNSKPLDRVHLIFAGQYHPPWAIIELQGSHIVLHDDDQRRFNIASPDFIECLVGHIQKREIYYLDRRTKES